MLENWLAQKLLAVKWEHWWVNWLENQWAQKLAALWALSANYVEYPFVHVTKTYHQKS